MCGAQRLPDNSRLRKFWFIITHIGRVMQNGPLINKVYAGSPARSQLLACCLLAALNCLIRSSNTGRKWRIKPCTGQAAPSPKAQMV